MRFKWLLDRSLCQIWEIDPTPREQGSVRNF